MEASPTPSRAPMDDVRAVDWLPLEDAIERLSRAYERAFLENVGPLALEAAAAMRLKVKKPAVLEKRRRQPVAVPQPPLMIPTPAVPQGEPLLVGNDVVDAVTTSAAEDISATIVVESPSGHQAPSGAARRRRMSLVQKVRDWLRRA